MAVLDWRKLASRLAGRPPIPKFSVVAGTTAATNIAIAGIQKDDQIAAVLEFQDTAGATVCIVADRVAETSVTTPGNIQLSTTNTSAHGLLVIWYKVRL